MKDPEEAKITIVLPICVVVLAAAAYGLFGKCKTASKQSGKKLHKQIVEFEFQPTNRG